MRRGSAALAELKRALDQLLDIGFHEGKRLHRRGYHGAVDRCTRDRTWSYVQRPEDEPDELYNLAADPAERENLIDSHHEEAVRLASSFGSHFKRRPTRMVKGVQGEYEMSSSSIE